MALGAILKRIVDQRTGLDDQGNLILRGSRIYWGSDGAEEFSGYVDLSLLSPANGTLYPVEFYGAKGDGVTSDTGAILRAAQAAQAAGGGTVLFQAKTYFAPANGVGVAPLLEGVTYYGVPPIVSNDNNFNRNGGTWLLGDNTGPCFYVNNVPGTTQPTFNQIIATGVRNVAVIGIGVDNYTRGHHVGELMSPSILNAGLFAHNIARNCSQWGFFFENYVWCTFWDNQVYAPQAGAIGGIAHWVSTTNYNFGNALHLECVSALGFANFSTKNMRGMSFLARAGAQHNHISALSLQSTTFEALIACAATTVNGNTAIAVTAGQAANLPLDMPVVCSTSNSAPTQATGWGGFSLGQATTTTNGLAELFIVPFMLTGSIGPAGTSSNLSSAWQGATGTYKVTFYLKNGSTVSQNLTLTNGQAAFNLTALGTAAWPEITVAGTGGTSDYVQVALTMRGIPLAAGASASNFLVRWGFPNLEVAGYDKPSDPYNTIAQGSGIQGASIFGVDLEGEGTCLALAQNANLTLTALNFLGGAGAQGTAYAARVCTRGGNPGTSGITTIGSNQGLSLDCASPPPQVVGTALSNTSADPTRIVYLAPIGIMGDLSNSGQNQLNLGTGQSVSPTTLLQLNLAAPNSAANHLDAVYFSSPYALHQKAITFNYAGFPWDTTCAGTVIYKPASGTLDTGTMQTMDGTAPGSTITSQAGLPFEVINTGPTTLQLTSASGPYQEQTGYTSYKILPGGTVQVRGCWDGSANFYGVLGGGHIPCYTGSNPAIIADGQPRWTQVGVVTNATFSTAGLTNSVNLFQLPAGAVIHDVRIKHSQSFTGGAIATYTISVGITGTVNKYANAFNVFQATGNTAYQDSIPQSGLNCPAAVTGSENAGAATTITATATSTGANLNAATQGSATIWALVSAAG